MIELKCEKKLSLDNDRGMHQHVLEQTFFLKIGSWGKPSFKISVKKLSKSFVNEKRNNLGKNLLQSLKENLKNTRGGIFSSSSSVILVDILFHMKN